LEAIREIRVNAITNLQLTINNDYPPDPTAN